MFFFNLYRKSGVYNYLLTIFIFKIVPIFIKTYQPKIIIRKQIKIQHILNFKITIGLLANFFKKNIFPLYLVVLVLSEKIY